MNRKVVFLLGCIPARILLAYIAKKTPRDKQIYLGIIFLAIGLTFLKLYFLNERTTSPEAQGEVWWAKYRIIHGLLYLTAAILAFKKDDRVYVPLVIDVLVGFSIFVKKELLN